MEKVVKGVKGEEGKKPTSLRLKKKTSRNLELVRKDLKLDIDETIEYLLRLAVLHAGLSKETVREMKVGKKLEFLFREAEEEGFNPEKCDYVTLIGLTIKKLKDEREKLTVAAEEILEATKSHGEILFLATRIGEAEESDNLVNIEQLELEE